MLHKNVEVAVLDSLFSFKKSEGECLGSLFINEIFFHSLRVGNIAKDICRAMSLNDEEAAELFTLSILHDIGKCEIPVDILFKPARLTFEERTVIEAHPALSQKLAVEGYKLSDYCGKIIRHHHENMDGSGYPDKLIGDEIPLQSRILAIADVFDAITSPRCYRPAMQHEPIMFMRYNLGYKFDTYIFDNYAKSVLIKYLK